MLCIYKLTNTINGLIYIGQTNNPKRRKKEYSIKKITKRSQKYALMEDIVKYGFDNFTFDIVEECSTRDELHEKEKYWISELNTTDPLIGYNKKTGGRGGILNEESKLKMSKTTKSFRHSEETKLKKSIPIISVKDGIIEEWSSAKTLADYLDLKRTNVTRAIKHGYRVKGYFVFYRDEDLRNVVFVNKEGYNEALSIINGCRDYTNIYITID